ncbi:hypothetical protein HYALB_00012463 [Hymenoscyphus albidus]|uniref:Uncharacterized protein n=1 Tax=Hymenoscyphus albidus TaxID=595503 RepID=A0A9N9LNE6_9HELO|nr:hypothetical protein HYALB_00012463 [Hymenoscyphus albidus]
MDKPRSNPPRSARPLNFQPPPQPSSASSSSSNSQPPQSPSPSPSPTPPRRRRPSSRPRPSIQRRRRRRSPSPPHQGVLRALALPPPPRMPKNSAVLDAFRHAEEEADEEARRETVAPPQPPPVRMAVAYAAPAIPRSKPQKRPRSEAGDADSGTSHGGDEHHRRRQQPVPYRADIGRFFGEEPRMGTSQGAVSATSPSLRGQGNFREDPSDPEEDEDEAERFKFEAELIKRREVESLTAGTYQRSIRRQHHLPLPVGYKPRVARPFAVDAESAQYALENEYAAVPTDRLPIELQEHARARRHDDLGSEYRKWKSAGHGDFANLPVQTPARQTRPTAATSPSVPPNPFGSLTANKGMRGIIARHEREKRMREASNTPTSSPALSGNPVAGLAQGSQAYNPGVVPSPNPPVHASPPEMSFRVNGVIQQDPLYNSVKHLMKTQATPQIPDVVFYKAMWLAEFNSEAVRSDQSLNLPKMSLDRNTGVKFLAAHWTPRDQFTIPNIVTFINHAYHFAGYAKLDGPDIDNARLVLAPETLTMRFKLEMNRSNRAPHHQMSVVPITRNTWEEVKDYTDYDNLVYGTLFIDFGVRRTDEPENQKGGFIPGSAYGRGRNITADR